MIPLTGLSCCYFFNDGSVRLYNILTLKHSQNQRNRLVHLHMLETQVQGWKTLKLTKHTFCEATKKMFLAMCTRLYDRLRDSRFLERWFNIFFALLVKHLKKLLIKFYLSLSSLTLFWQKIESSTEIILETIKGKRNNFIVVKCFHLGIWNCRTRAGERTGQGIGLEESPKVRDPSGPPKVGEFTRVFSN